MILHVCKKGLILIILHHIFLNFQHKMDKLQGCFTQLIQKSVTVIFMRFPDGSDVQLVPENSTMTCGVLTELAGLGKGSVRWTWISANCLRRDEENEWRAEWRSGSNHSVKVPLWVDKHQSKAEIRVMKERMQKEGKMKPCKMTVMHSGRVRHRGL